MKSIIYKFTHTPSGKYYIGSLKDGSKFQSYKSSSKVVSKMIALNPEDWTKEILIEYIDVEFSTVVVREQELIEEVVARDGWDKIWNQFFHVGVSGCYSPESRKKAIQSLNTPESIANMRKSIIKKYEDDPSYKRKISETVKRQMQDPARKAVIAKANSERVHSEETRRKLSESHKGKKHSPETMIKMREILRKAREKMAEIRASKSK
jgi:hypothetical protein